MNYQNYEIPSNIDELFKNKEASYRIINYDPSMSMDNIQSMNHFLDCLNISEQYIDEHGDTQVFLKHPDYDYKIVIDSGGLGDFFSHGFDVTIITEFDQIREDIINQISNIKYQGDLSDIGNEIGIIIAKYFKNLDDFDTFVSGLKHGISLTDGTH